MPWRRASDPYVVWLSEVLLQQTRVEQGLPYFERFLAAFPDVRALAAAPEDEVLKRWEGLGYYARARNLQKAARIIVLEHGGQFPERAEDWRRLPGIGRYTAGAIASIAFGEPVPAVDGNVKRVLARVFNIAQCIDDAKTLDRLWSLAETLVQGTRPGDFNQALMELGARICTPRSPRCEACPVQPHCASYAEGLQGKRPVRKPKKAVPHHEVVVAAIRRNGRYLIAKRPGNGLLPGLWEFPAGKCLPGEPHQIALERLAQEALAVEIEVGGMITTTNHAYSHFRTTLTAYRCRYVAGKPEPAEHTQLRWVRRGDFPRYPFHKANHKFMHLL